MSAIKKGSRRVNARVALKWVGCASLVGTVGLALPGCGGSHGGGDGGSSAQLSSQALVPAGSKARFDAYYQKGMQNVSTGRQAYAPLASTSEDAGMGRAFGGGGFGISDTNLIEQGVDEADLIKQNEGYIFTAQNPQVYYFADVAEPYPGSQANVFDINVFAKPGTTPVSKIELNGAYSQGIYLVGDALASVATKQYANWYYLDIAATQNGQTEVDLIDIKNPIAPAVKKHYEWDGDYVTSRRIGDSLFVISRFGMDMIYATQVIDPGKGDAAITSPSNSSTLPEKLPVTINGSVVDAASCLIPQQIEEANIVPSVTLITQISISDSFAPRTTCVAGSAPEVYVGAESLYFLGQDWENNATHVHKFSLSDGVVEYRASGAVAGYVNWQDPYFSVSEYKDVFRMMTVDWSGSSVVNRLITLEESKQERGALIKLAELPNADHPEPIGKENEAMQAVRFLGETAYVVTFRTVDPLYKLDLSNPSDPRLAGALEMPGYSAYLQPINEKFLLGVGYSVDNEGRQNGIQLSVFDVAQAEPKLVSQETLSAGENAWMYIPLDWDTHAITTLSNRTTTRVLLPYFQYDYQSLIGYQSNLGEFEINESSGALVRAGVEHYTVDSGSQLSRSILDGDNVYSLFDSGSLLRTVWGEGN